MLVVQKLDCFHSRLKTLEQQNLNGRVGEVLIRLRGGKRLGLGVKLLVIRVGRRRAVKVL